MQIVGKIAARACRPRSPNSARRKPSVSPRRVSPPTIESLIHPQQDLNEPPVSLCPLATMVPVVQARKPLLCLLAVPDRSPQGVEQPWVRLEGRAAADDVGRLFVVAPAFQSRDLVRIAGDLMPAGLEKALELGGIFCCHWGVAQGRQEHFLEAVVFLNAPDGPLADSCVERVRRPICRWTLWFLERYLRLDNGLGLRN